MDEEKKQPPEPVIVELGRRVTAFGVWSEVRWQCVGCGRQYVASGARHLNTDESAKDLENDLAIIETLVTKKRLAATCTGCGSFFLLEMPSIIKADERIQTGQLDPAAPLNRHQRRALAKVNGSR